MYFQTLVKSIAVAMFLTLPTSAQIFTPEQYVKALWMSTRFFGAQRSGVGPNWILQDTEFPQSFVKDRYNGRDISGGWFDCGDHVMFGQTQFYSSYMLAKAMTTFNYGWHDHYNGTTYADYKASQNYTMSGGTPNGIPDILEELRYIADFIVKITPNGQTFILQKGDGRVDHLNWVTAGKMATLPKARGGESDSSRLIVANPSDAYAAGMAAATLAVMARRDPDANRRSLYKQHALNAYNYAWTHTGVQSAVGNFYRATWWTGRWREARVIAAFELFETTQDSSYIRTAIDEFQFVEPGVYNRVEYTNAIPIARVMALQYLGYASANLDSYLSTLRTGVNAEGVADDFVETTDFATRSPMGAAAVHAFKAMQENTTAYDAFIFSQVDYVLGRNSNHQAYLVGWEERDLQGNLKKQPNKPHHRGYYGNTDPTKSDASFNSVEAPINNRLLGGLVGGSFDGSYVADLVNWRFNEVCTDMNATLVAALGYIVHRVAPTAQPIPVSPPKKRNRQYQLTLHQNLLEIRPPNSQPYTVEIFDLKGSGITKYHGGEVMQWQAPVSGLYHIRIKDQYGVQIQNFQIFN